MTREVQLPGLHLAIPRDGGGAEQRLASVERRLRRLHKPDPLALLDEVIGGETLRATVEDPARLEMMERKIGRLEEGFGAPGLLKFGQPLMLDPPSAGYQPGDPEHSKRWIMLLDVNYPKGGTGPVPLISTVCVYSHTHRGLLAAIDLENPDNTRQVFWGFDAATADESNDAASIVDGTVKIQLYAHNMAALELNNNGEFTAGDAPLAAASIWPEIAKRSNKIEKNLARFGRTVKPTVNLTLPQ